MSQSSSVRKSRGRPGRPVGSRFTPPPATVDRTIHRDVWYSSAEFARLLAAGPKDVLGNPDLGVLDGRVNRSDPEILFDPLLGRRMVDLGYDRTFEAVSRAPRRAGDRHLATRGRVPRRSRSVPAWRDVEMLVSVNTGAPGVETPLAGGTISCPHISSAISRALVAAGASMRPATLP